MCDLFILKGASKHRSLDEAPSFGILAQACTSNFSFDVRLEDTSEIVLTSTGSTVSERTSHEHDVPLQHEDFHLVLDQSSGKMVVYVRLNYKLISLPQ